MTTAERTESSSATAEGTDTAAGRRAEPSAPPQSFRSKFAGRLRATWRGGGPHYSAIYAVRWLAAELLERLDRYVVSVEQKRAIVEPWTVSARRNTVDQNKAWWDKYDWSRLGEEWTKSEEWKERIIRELILPNIPAGGTVVEVGPGGGRWTEVLRGRAAKLYVVDVSERVIELCRERFAGSPHIDYLLTDGSRIDVPGATVDAIWSYDVFVHIDPLTVRGYIHEFRRVLKPGGRAMIHHAGPPRAEHRRRRRAGWRSELTDEMVVKFARECGLEVISQSTELVAVEGDVLSILAQPVRGMS